MALSRYCLTQIRSTVNFFARYREDQLWKTITSVSPAGMKKGRRNTRQPVRPLEKFFKIGTSNDLLNKFLFFKLKIIFYY